MKADLRRLLQDGDLAAIAAWAGRQRRVLSYLTALTYDPDPQVAGRAIEAFGLAASAISEVDPEFVRGHLRRLFWLLNDESGGIGWRAPELIGEVLRRQPHRFAEFIPNLLWLLDMETEDAPRFQASILRGILAVGQATDLAQVISSVKGTTARQAAGLPGFTELLYPLLTADNEEVRSLARQCLNQVAGRIV